jgi:hypothetical protein
MSDEIDLESAEFKLACAELASDAAPREVRMFDEAGKNILTLKRKPFPNESEATAGNISNIFLGGGKADRQKLFFSYLRELRQQIRDGGGRPYRENLFFARVHELGAMVRELSS